MTKTQYLALQMLKKCQFPSYFYFQLLPSYCLSDISAWTSPKCLKFKRFQTKLLIHLTSLHTLLLLPTHFSPRLFQFSKWHHQPTRHSDAHASNVESSLTPSFSHSYPPQLILQQVLPFLSGIYFSELSTSLHPLCRQPNPIN